MEASGRRLSLGGREYVPYPTPTSAAATAIGKGNKRSGTRPEAQLRSELHRRGLRFRKDHRIDAGDVRVRGDVVFPKRKVAAFVDGCFWHGCPDHGRAPKANPAYWAPKLASNVARDRRVDAALAEAGWQVVRIWEHEAVADAADRVADAVASRSADARRRGDVSPSS